MMLSYLSFIAALAVCEGFSPSFITANSARFAARTSQGKTCLKENNLPFFASQSNTPKDDTEEDSETVEERARREAQEELKKGRKMSNLRNANGVDYAPWMNISEEDEKQIRQITLERARARQIRKEQETQVSGNLYFDSQAQELSGTGLKSKVIDGDVELEWGTKSEMDCAGFIIKRRPAKTENFSVIETYETFAPLASKGRDGGVYRYLDTTATPGGWVYRVSEATTTGEESDLCQCLVEVQTEDEQKAAVFAAAGIAIFAVLAVVAGITLDPLQ
jgi:hypothetical protein